MLDSLPDVAGTVGSYNLAPRPVSAASELADIFARDER